jgi:hypothetical protein
MRPEGAQRDDGHGGLHDLLKRQHAFEEWHGITRLEEKLLVRNFFLGGHELPGWRAERLGRPEIPGWPPATRSTWMQNDSEQTLLTVETFECPDIGAAHELLVRALAEFQSPDMTRSEPGDVGFSMPGRTAALFARANMVVLIRNGGRAVVEVTEVAGALDEWIWGRPEEGGPVAPDIARLEPGRAELAVGRPVDLDLQATDPLGRELWFKFYSRLGDVRFEKESPVYRATTPGVDEVTVFAVNENGAAATRTIELSIPSG